MAPIIEDEDHQEESPKNQSQKSEEPSFQEWSRS